MAVRREYIAQQYRDLLGREGAEHEIAGWENAPDENSVRQMFMGSPEYASRTGGQASWEDVGGVITPNAPQQQHQTQGGDDGRSAVPRSGTGAPTAPAAPAAPAAQTQNQATIRNWYKQLLGRDATEDDVTQWLSGAYGWGDANNLQGIWSGIRMSDEATRHRAANPTTSYSAAPYTGFTTTGNDYSAFNTSRQQDPGKSAKDAFAYLSNQAPAPPFHDKRAMANWFTQYVQPGMNALGHTVISVNEDGFTYKNHEGTFHVDFGQNSGAAAGSMQQRLQWLATPADDATRARYATSGGSGSSSGGARSGAASTVGDIRSVFQSLPKNTNFSGPGDAGITNGPLQQVGQDPFSTLITNALAGLIQNQGKTDLGNSVEDAITALMERGGELDPNQTARRYESARELLDKGRRTMVNDLRGDLASRNLLSEPGIPQGAEIGGINRVTEKIAPEFSRALRDIFTDESAKADTRLMTSLSMAMGVSSEQARTMLAALGEGTNRQAALADIALRNLAQNQAWSQFLAQFGLDRDTAMYQIQNGQIESILPILQMFLQLGGMANQGYV